MLCPRFLTHHIKDNKKFFNTSRMNESPLLSEVVALKPKALHAQGKDSTTELHPWSQSLQQRLRENWWVMRLHLQPKGISF